MERKPAPVSLVPPVKLRENLGLPSWLVEPLLSSKSKFRRPIELLSSTVLPAELVVLRILAILPDRLKHFVIMFAFKACLFLHQMLPSRIARRGLSDSLSLEAHALGNAVWLMRLAPMTLRRLRCAMESIGWLHVTKTVKQEKICIPHLGVSGVYLHSSTLADDAPVLLWFFPGAFFGGSAASNRGLAERYAKQLDCDVFLPDYRLCPEHKIEDAYKDACRAYEWLLSRKSPEKIVACGISAGGGICLRLLQLAAAEESQRSIYFQSSKIVPQPAGAVLMGPFLNFQNPNPDHSIVQFTKIDWLVTQRVYEFLEPQLNEACGGEDGRRKMSPLFHSMDGLCPILLSFSEHEVCIDDIQVLVEKLRVARNDVKSLGQPFLCHAFQLLAPILPEAVQAEIQICEWIKQRGWPWNPEPMRG